ncbi:hypothetical protein F7T25_15970 [Salmonella enterica]|nr:hypothetical protein [Salmonella enterica]
MYVIACAIVCGIAAAQALFSMPAIYEALAAGNRRASFKMWVSTGGLVLLPALLMAAPVFTSFYDAVRMAGGDSIAVSSGRTSVAIGLVGALAVVALTIGRAIASWPHVSFWSAGRLLAGIVFGCIAITATASHLLFLDENSGMVSFGFFRDQVKDMRCDSDVILARWDMREGTPVVYRCPKAYVLNGYSGAPFVPWPDYTEGVSVDLGKALHAALKDAK